jgi:5-deoxy-glucuronate isomerase
MSWHIPAGSASDGDAVVSITPERAGWSFTGLTVLDLRPGSVHAFATTDEEAVVLPLAGACDVDSSAGRAHLAGRAGVFAAVSDCAYIPLGSQVRLTSAAGGRFAVARAKASRRLPFRHVAAEDVRVELRGAGACSRQVNNFATPDVLDADRLIACEVLTPGGNWSSYPPHKHDEARLGESVLEEIYYFEVAAGPGGPGLAYQRAYGTPGRPADVLAEVRSGDVVVIPHGWHGPSMAAPGYDLYYLNVMAGPGHREWLICDDPAHSWVRGQWAHQRADPRLPMTRAEAQR